MTSCSSTRASPTGACGRRRSRRSRRPATASLAPDLPGFGDAALEPPTVDYVELRGRVARRARGRRRLLVRRPRRARARRVEARARRAARPRRRRARLDWKWSEDAQAGFAEEEALLERGDLAGAAEQQARMWLAPDASDDGARADRGDDRCAPTSSSCRSRTRSRRSGRSRRRRAARRARRADAASSSAPRTSPTSRDRASGSPTRSPTPGSRRSRAPAICRASSGRTSSTGYCSTSS